MGMSSSYRMVKSGEAGETTIYLRFATTTAGAVGTVKRKRGFIDPVRVSAGLYTFGLADKWPPLSLIAAAAYPVGGATVDATKAQGNAKLVSEDPAGLAAAANVKFQFLAAAGTAADVQDGADIMVVLTLKDVTV